MIRSPFRVSPAVVAQVLLVLAGLTGAVLAPPASGALLALPLTGSTMADTINLAVANGATVDRAGPFRGSIVVRGRRDRLARPLRAHGIVLLAASSMLCGT